MRTTYCVRIQVALAALLVAPISVALAQVDARFDQRRLDRWLERQRAEEVSRDQTREEIAPLSTFFNWQWGGWIEYFAFSFDDGVQSQRVLQRPALSMWTRLSFDNDAHEIFARMRLSYEYYNPGDEFDRQHDWIGPNLDRGWYRIDVLRALHARSDSSPFDLSVKIGRQETRFGTGYTLDLPLDAVRFDARFYDFHVAGLLARTISSFPNLIDRSQPVAGHMYRQFYGVQTSYEGFDGHELYAYALWNNDKTDERPEDFFQNYSYDTRYFGFGSRGEIVHNLGYWWETVFETGRSFGDGQIVRRDRVDSWGVDVGVEKHWDHEMRPRVSFEYMFGSGDPDRKLSPTSAAGGNRGDRRDTSLVTLGYRDTGIATNFLYSNLHIWRVGASFTPAPQAALLRNLELGTNWFVYHKNHRRAAISDPTADMYSGYVGWEMDYYANWRVSSDVSWTIRWGTFFPGQAFQERSSRHYLFTGLTWSF